MVIQVLTNLAVKAYELYLSIKKAIPKMKAKLGALWEKLQAFLQKKSAKAPEDGAESKVEEKQIE